MLQEQLDLSRVEWQRVNIRLLNFLLDQVLSFLLVFSPILVRHPFKFLKETAVLLELLEMWLPILTYLA